MGLRTIYKSEIADILTGLAQTAKASGKPGEYQEGFMAGLQAVAVALGLQVQVAKDDTPQGQGQRRVSSQGWAQLSQGEGESWPKRALRSCSVRRK